MSFSLQRVSKRIYLSLIAISLLVGTCIPRFYDWSGADQSRSSPVIEPIAIGLLLGWIVVCAVIGFRAGKEPVIHALHNERLQFRIRTILILTTATAVGTVALRHNTSIALSGGLYVSVMAFCIYLLIARSFLRWRGITLLACMYLPFTWLVTHERASDSLPDTLFMVTLLPSVLLTPPIASLLGQHPEKLLWLGSVLTSCQVLLSLLWFSKSERLSIGYDSLCLLLSTYGSFAVNALLRM